jgi:hypothetical protein
MGHLTWSICLICGGIWTVFLTLGWGIYKPQNIKKFKCQGVSGYAGGGGMLKLFASSVLTRLLNLLILLTTWPFKWFIKYNMTSSVHVNEPTSHNRRNISGSLWEFFEIYSAIGLVYSLTAPFLTIQRYFDTSSLSFGEAMSVLGILALETPHKW